MADDLGWADVGFHGGNAPTPHLDGLLKRGTELRQHYVAPVCSPTRTGLMTGRCWSRFGITTPTNTLALPFETTTLPRALKDSGYETCLVGKWHLGSLPQWGPNHFGFDHSYGSLAGGISPWNHRYKKGPFSFTWHRNEELIEESGHVTDLLTAEAEQWIKSRGRSPFFLYVPYTAIHLPLKEPDVWVQKAPKSITGDVARHYAASIMHLDDAVGRIIAALESKGVLHNTCFVFTSDNGGSNVENNDLKYPDDQCPNGRLPGNNQPLRGRKGDVYEGGIRVPTLIHWPSRIAPGQIDTPIQITDWMPTFCAFAGYQPTTDLNWDGVNLSDLLLHRTPLPERILYTAGTRGRSASLRSGKWKLVVHHDGDKEKHELFNLSIDPSEQRDLAEVEPTRLKELIEQLKMVAMSDNDSVAPKQ